MDRDRLSGRDEKAYGYCGFSFCVYAEKGNVDPACVFSLDKCRGSGISADRSRNGTDLGSEFYSFSFDPCCACRNRAFDGKKRGNGSRTLCRAFLIFDCSAYFPSFVRRSFADEDDGRFFGDPSCLFRDACTDLLFTFDDNDFGRRRNDGQLSGDGKSTKGPSGLSDQDRYGSDRRGCDFMGVPFDVSVWEAGIASVFHRICGVRGKAFASFFYPCARISKKEQKKRHDVYDLNDGGRGFYLCRDRRRGIFTVFVDAFAGRSQPDGFDDVGNICGKIG